MLGGLVLRLGGQWRQGGGGWSRCRVCFWGGGCRWCTGTSCMDGPSKEVVVTEGSQGVSRVVACNSREEVAANHAIGGLYVQVAGKWL